MNANTTTPYPQGYPMLDLPPRDREGLLLVTFNMPSVRFWRLR